MPELDHTDSDAETATESPDEAIRVIELPTATGTARVTLPPDADGEEAAAIAAAVHTHLDEDEADEEESTEYTSPWALSGRMGLRSADRLPACPRGDEWKVAGRVRY